MTYSPPGASHDAVTSALIVMRKAFTASGGGSAGDVVLYNGAVPFGLRILSMQLFVSTAVALSTATLRSATGGGGSALFAALATAVTGSVQLPTTETATVAVSAGDSLVLRRSDTGIAGEVILFCVRT